MINEIVEFDVSKRNKLIPMGFKMKKYWANNYIGYSYDINKCENIILWLAGKDIQMDNIDEDLQVPLFKILKEKENLNDFIIQKINHFSKKKELEDVLMFKLNKKNELETVKNEFEVYTGKRINELKHYIKNQRKNNRPDLVEKYKKQIKEEKKYMKDDGFEYQKCSKYFIFYNWDILNFFKTLIDEEIIHLVKKDIKE